MRVKVSELYDMNQLSIPEDMLKISIDNEEVENGINRLKKIFAEESDAEIVTKGDLAICEAKGNEDLEDRKILIYSGLGLPGAEDAEKAVIGKKVGDEINTDLNGRAVKLLINEIKHYEEAELSDKLVALLNLENVNNLDEYREYLVHKAYEVEIKDKNKDINRYILDKMIDNSRFEFNDAEIKAYIDHLMELELPMYQAEGIDISEEELRESLFSQLKDFWIADAYCEKNNIKFDLKEIEEETDRMIEMMTLMGEEVEDREEMLDQTRQNEALSKLFQDIDKYIKLKRGE